jgi:hypothetical protein
VSGELDAEASSPASTSRHMRHAGTALLALGVGTIWAVSIWKGQPKGDGREYAQTLRQEFERISPPRGLTAASGAREVAKRSSTLIEQRYSGYVPVEDVLSSYDAQLLRNGWRYSANFQGGSNWGQTYCKGEFAASIEVMPFEHSFFFSFSMAWDGFTVHECSAAHQSRAPTT